MSKIIRLGPTSDNVTYYLPVELPDVFALHSNEIVLYCIKCDPETHKIPEYLCNLKTRFINAPLDQLWVGIRIQILHQKFFLQRMFLLTASVDFDFSQ